MAKHFSMYLTYVNVLNIIKIINYMFVLMTVNKIYKQVQIFGLEFTEIYVHA